MQATAATTTVADMTATSTQEGNDECDAMQVTDTASHDVPSATPCPMADTTTTNNTPSVAPVLSKVFAYECHVETGSPDRALRSAPALGVAAPRTVFDGECYLCGGEGHSQNYCPLSRCHTCHRYGHTERACCFAARPWGLYTTAAATAAATAAVKKTHHRHAYGGRAMFGSGWHGSAAPRTGVVGWR
ncbi:zinc-finger CCHC-type motif-containing protein [Pandoravirus inopinatum]|uniref:Zinc-finger CCHC-type motif-containing protein n=1 Tax=Pandoravirus inopinatum TaxID=1605721 RepID=A0A0B5IYT7_9VIRU|nr:zinc-finger CCHC-type motif-containing protein [Pandoravirus inopinatum]AJF98053.1 zinc-finger CCHC-type motif-containing protein [Pandoravirus inopinatum]